MKYRRDLNELRERVQALQQVQKKNSLVEPPRHIQLLTHLTRTEEQNLELDAFFRGHPELVPPPYRDTSREARWKIYNWLAGLPEDSTHNDLCEILAGVGRDEAPSTT